MLMLIVLLGAGAGLVYISKYNFGLVSVNFGSFTIDRIPLFYVILGSVLVGLILSYLVNLVSSISNSLTLRHKNNQLKKEKRGGAGTYCRVHQLELENPPQDNDPNAL
jgi:uncharacterized integral membrane protein